MQANTGQLKVLQKLCDESNPHDGMEAITSRLKIIFPDLDFEHVLTRGHWHRLGGVVDSNYQRVTDNIAAWVEQESGGDLEELMLKYVGKDYVATVLAGKTHYYTASTGRQAEDFMQIEIEELQEVVDRLLVDPDWIPDNIEDFLDPLDYSRLEQEPVGEPVFKFRRITNFSELLNKPESSNQEMRLSRQFLQDWNSSSAAESSVFCQHWVLALREYKGRDGTWEVTAKPIPTRHHAAPELPDSASYSGSELARAIHGYDRSMGYPFSWFFMMITRKSENLKLADAVMNDLMGAYDYLPAKDLKVLRDWVLTPYSV